MTTKTLSAARDAVYATYAAKCDAARVVYDDAEAALDRTVAAYDAARVVYDDAKAALATARVALANYLAACADHDTALAEKSEGESK